MQKTSSVKGRTQMLAVVTVILSSTGCNRESIVAPTALSSARSAVTHELTMVPEAGVVTPKGLQFLSLNDRSLSTRIEEPKKLVTVPVKATKDAPVGESNRVERGPNGSTVTLRLSRSEAGAPFSRVETESEGKMVLRVTSEWARRGQHFLLLSRSYERVTPDGIGTCQ